MKKLLFGLCSVACLSACAISTMVPYQVNSTPPGAQIDVNGVSMGIAPIQIELACIKRWVCPPGPHAHCRWEFDDYVYEVTAHPTKDNPGLSQTERVNVCQLKAPAAQINFDLRLDAVAPRQTIDVNANQKDKTTSLDDTRRTLESSRDQGMLSEQEYEQKMDKPVKDDAR